MARDHDAKNDGDPVPERPSSDLFTAEQARAMLEEFRAMVREGILEVTPGNEVLQVEKPVEPKSDPRESSPSIFSEEGVRFFNRRVSERLRESAREEPEPPAPEPVARRAAPRESL
ncbi:MAG: hypothetical protein HY013_16055, partial [Candidatus Solibacter usitatus]|nr:hypothetical protein [Candidatus Solibacter usitatus]